MEIATVAILLYVLSLPRWLEVFSFLLLSEDFAASFWLWAFRAGSSDGIGGTFFFGASPGFSGVSILFPQYKIYYPLRFPLRILNISSLTSPLIFR